MEVKRAPQVTNWYLLSLAFLSLFTFGFVDNGRGPIFPDLLREFSLNDSVGSLFFLTASTTALLNNLVFFSSMERIGAFRCLQIYSVLQALGLIIIGLATNYPTVLLGAALIGTSLGGNGIAVNLLVAESVPVQSRRQAFSGLHCMYGVASLLAPLLVTWFYTMGLSWKVVLAAMSVGPFAVLVMSFLRRTQGGYRSQAESQTPSERTATIKPWRVAMFFSLVCTCYVVVELSIGTRLALLARRDWGYPTDEANLLLSAYFVGLFLGRLIFAIWTTPWSHLRVLQFSAVFSLVFFVLGLLFSPLWMAVAGLAISVFYPSMIAMINDECAEWAGFVTSWCITLQSLGLIAMHFALGALADGFGLRNAMWLGPFCAFLVVLLLILKSRFALVLPARTALSRNVPKTV